MHYCEYEYSKVFYAVKDAIWETVHETTPDMAFDYRPSSGIIDYVLYGSKDLGGEIIAQAGVMALIIIDLFFEFLSASGWNEKVISQIVNESEQRPRARERVGRVQTVTLRVAVRQPSATLRPLPLSER